MSGYRGRCRITASNVGRGQLRQTSGGFELLDGSSLGLKPLLDQVESSLEVAPVACTQTRLLALFVLANLAIGCAPAAEGLPTIAFTLPKLTCT
jgi:hypothetical protein